MQGGEQARHPIWVNALSPLDGHDGESTWQWRNTAGRSGAGAQPVPSEPEDAEEERGNM